jgi:hypothetical protein
MINFISASICGHQIVDKTNTMTALQAVAKACESI